MNSVIFGDAKRLGIQTIEVRTWLKDVKSTWLKLTGQYDVLAQQHFLRKKCLEQSLQELAVQRINDVIPGPKH